ncbi:MAG: metallophosphoesterase, partial [Saprospiraceae bacterium]|nr:metallophosphoesterase [Saprospiraceae bacterium]
MNEEDIIIKEQGLATELSLRIALIGDIHLPDTEEDYDRLSALLDDINREEPDIIIFAGDYTSSPKKISNMADHRSRIVELLAKENLSKKLFVLGNYESWSNSESWAEEFKVRNAILLENEVHEFQVKDQFICIRGLGDYYTKKYNYVEFPTNCDNQVKFSVTHDPAGAFDGRVKGLVLAAHTHCGQVRIPLYGALWIPSSAPEEATCGLYKDNQRTVFTTAGAGTSL